MADDSTNKIRVIFCGADKRAEIVEIEDRLKAMQELVGGRIEEYMPWEDEVALICNDEGKSYSSLSPRTENARRGDIKFWKPAIPIVGREFGCGCTMVWTPGKPQSRTRQAPQRGRRSLTAGYSRRLHHLKALELLDSRAF